MEQQTTRNTVSGFYVAQHPWLSQAGPDLYKVGHTGDLGKRLLDSAYVTCFPEGWRFIRTYEVANKEQAQLLETEVLRRLYDLRVDGRELVAASLAHIEAAVTNALDDLRLSATRRLDPEYAAPPPRPRDSCEPAEDPDELTALLESLLLDVSDSADSTELATTSAEPATTSVEPVTASIEPATASIEPATTQDEFEWLEETQLDDGDGEAFHYADGALSLRPYQEEAAARCAEELAAGGRTVLQMACRCGKTPTAARIAFDYERVLFLVPGLALLRQTVLKLLSYGYKGRLLLVGSDPRPLTVGARGVLRMTTVAADIAAALDTPGRLLVVSTYQSSPLLRAADYGLVVFDEAHRVCGGDAPRPFNAVVLQPQTLERRLYMTATPVYEQLAVTMRSAALFGGVAYRYHLRQGIDAGHVNPFRLELAAAPSMPAAIAAASGRVTKLLVFCRDIRRAAELRAAVDAEFAAAGAADPAPQTFEAHSRMARGAVVETLRRFARAPGRAILFNVRLLQEGVEIPELDGVFFAAPRRAPRDIIQSVCRPLNRLEGKGESAVFLPVIAQDEAGLANLKNYAAIVPFVDALLDEDPSLYEHLFDPSSREYALGACSARALGLGEQWAGARGALWANARAAVRFNRGGGERLLRAARVPWDRAYAEIKRVVEECHRYPKTTDLFRVGEATASLHAVYRYYASLYARRMALQDIQDDTESDHDSDAPDVNVPDVNAPDPDTLLEPYQARALEALPHWKTYGVEGPYPWRECMDFLEAWLAEKGTPPPVEINKGGFVCFSATPMERLSGALTCVNQQTFGKLVKGVLKTGNRVPADRQADLDRICAKYGLSWRKKFRDNGTVDPKHPTFIQTAFSKFKELYRQNPNHEYVARWFPGYPAKHATQEEVGIDPGLLPPRRRSRAPAAGRGTRSAPKKMGDAAKKINDAE